jgi:hypothetical protein
LWETRRVFQETVDGALPSTGSTASTPSWLTNGATEFPPLDGTLPDAAAVRRVARFITTAQERSLANAFRDYKSYGLQLQNVAIVVAPTGSTATAHARVIRTFEPKNGRSQSAAGDESFELQKDGSAWVITRWSGAAPSR